MLRRLLLRFLLGWLKKQTGKYQEATTLVGRWLASFPLTQTYKIELLDFLEVEDDAVLPKVSINRRLYVVKMVVLFFPFIVAYPKYCGSGYSG